MEPRGEKDAVEQGHEAVPAGGAVTVYDAIIDDDRSANPLGLLMSLNMLIETPGGFDDTGDCQVWMREVGFRETRVEHLGGPDWMGVGIKQKLIGIVRFSRSSLLEAETAGIFGPGERASWTLKRRIHLRRRRSWRR